MELFEKLILDEASRAGTQFDDLPQLKGLINSGNWDEALNLAGTIDINFKTYSIELRKPITDPVDQAAIVQGCAANGITLRFKTEHNGQDTTMDKAKEITFISTNSDSANKVIPVIDQLTDSKVLPEHRGYYNDQPSNKDLQYAVLDRFNDIYKIYNTVDRSASGVVNKIELELGLNTYDNPFLIFFSQYSGSKLVKKDLIALNNLYSNGTIDESWLNATEAAGRRDILFKPSLYKKMDSANTIIDVVTKYSSFDTTSQEAINKRNSIFLNEKGEVLPYQTIASNLRTSIETGDVKSSKGIKTLVITDDDVKAERINVSRLSNSGLAELKRQLTNVENSRENRG